MTVTAPVALAAISPYVPPVVVTSAPTTLFSAGSSTYTNIGRAAVDKAGNVFYISHLNSAATLYEIPYAAPAATVATPTALITGVGPNNSDAVYVDPIGNLWVADGNGSATISGTTVYMGILEIPASVAGIPNTSLAQNVAASSLSACTAAPATACYYSDNAFATNLTGYYSQPSDIQVATISGTTYVYVVDYDDNTSSGHYNRVVRFSIASPGTGTLICDELPSNNLAAIAVDLSGDVYYVDSKTNGNGGSGNVYDFGTSTGLNGGGTSSSGALTGITSFAVGSSATITTAKIGAAAGIASDIYGNLYLANSSAISEVPNEGSTPNFVDEFGIISGLSTNVIYTSAIDEYGNLYYAGYTGVYELEYGGYNFGSLMIGAATGTSPNLNLYFNQSTTISGNYFLTGSPTSNTLAPYLQSFPYSGTTTCNGGARTMLQVQPAMWSWTSSRYILVC